MSEDKELTEEQLEQAAGGRKTTQGELGSNRNPATKPTADDGGGIFTGGGQTTETGDSIPPPYWTR
jgi:hypothetical protein